MMSYIRIADDAGYDLRHFCVPKHYEEDLEKVLIPNGLIVDRIEKLACEIAEAYNGNGLVILCVLKGGYKFFTDLIEKMMHVNRVSGHSSPIAIEFIRCRSYTDTESTGQIEIIGISDMSLLNGKDVLIVEDIIDTGLTMKALVKELHVRTTPRSLKVAALFLKRLDIPDRYAPDYIGFEVPPKFIVGYALDYNEHFRDLHHVCIINKNGMEKYKRR